MLMQFLPPEERKGEHRYKQGSFVLYDGRPSKEKQEKLIAEAVKNNEPLKKCPRMRQLHERIGSQHLL